MFRYQHIAIASFAISFTLFGIGNQLSYGQCHTQVLTKDSIDYCDTDHPTTCGPPCADWGDGFGSAVGIDGEVAIVGSWNASLYDCALGYSFTGAANIYENVAGTWTFKQELIPKGTWDGEWDYFDYFGFAVAISGDAALVGGYNDSDNGNFSGSVDAYDYNSGMDTWDLDNTELHASDAAADDNFGYSVAMAAGSDFYIAVIGAPYDDHNSKTDAGSAYIFKKTTGSWSQVAKLVAINGSSNDYNDEDFFGWSVAIAPIGDDEFRVVVGAYGSDPSSTSGAGAAYVYTSTSDGTSWSGTVAKLTASDKAAGDEFGWSVAMAPSGDRIVVGAWKDDKSVSVTNSGSAYVYHYSGSWSQITKLTAVDAASNDFFGQSVAINGHGGGAILVGAHKVDHDGLSNNGAAYIYRYVSSAWAARGVWYANAAASNDEFGWSVALNADSDYGDAFVGAWSDDNAFGSNEGAVYVFDVNYSDRQCFVDDSAVCCLVVCEDGGCDDLSVEYGDVDGDGDLDQDDVDCATYAFSSFYNCPNADIYPACTGSNTITLDDILAVSNAVTYGTDPCSCPPGSCP